MASLFSITRSLLGAELISVDGGVAFTREAVVLGDVVDLVATGVAGGLGAAQAVSVSGAYARDSESNGEEDGRETSHGDDRLCILYARANVCVECCS